MSAENREYSSVAILDAGAQYGKVIDRKVRELSVHSEILPITTPHENLSEYEALIISGGPESVYGEDSPKPDPNVFELDKPLLGICYGMHLINQHFGGVVEKKGTREDGPCTIEVDPASLIFKGLERQQDVLMSHGDSIGETAQGFKVVATSGDIVAGIADEKKRIYGLQFHPEVDLTVEGKSMLSNFLFEISGVAPTFKLEDRVVSAIEYIKNEVGERDVLSFASGGVDSTVCSTLLSKIIPEDKLHVVHIDSGFMRRDESAQVETALKNQGIDVVVIDASKNFYDGQTTIDGRETDQLRRTTDPETKRMIIGDTFMKTMDEVISELKLDPKNTVLAQGTLRPDLIESASELASGKANVIKTHHNDTALVRQLRAAGRVVEPLRDLHKDEVRKIGEMLGLPSKLVWRQPFPGPGLAIRLLCAEEPYVTPEFEEIAAELESYGDNDTWAHLLPVRTVGVQGDGRSYSYLAGLSGKVNWPKLMGLARQIPKDIHQINRVVYIFGDNIEEMALDITPTYPDETTIGLLREADHRVNQLLQKYSLVESISQVPVISFPANFGEQGKRSIALRPFITNDFMTGIPATPGNEMPEDALQEMVDSLLELPGVARVVYDLTSKPPGTTEWE